MFDPSIFNQFNYIVLLTRNILLRLLTTSSAIITIICGFSQSGVTLLINKKKVLKASHVTDFIVPGWVVGYCTVRKMLAIYMCIYTHKYTRSRYLRV